MTQKKKILYVHHSGNLGGAPRSLSFLLGKLNYLLYEVELLCIANGPGLNLFKNRPFKLTLNERIFPFHGSTVSGMPLKLFIRNLFYAPQSFFVSRRLINERKPDLIHLNSSSLCFTALAAKSVDKNIHVVCHIREPLLKNSFSAWIIRTLCYFCVDEFIAIDKYSEGSMKTRNNSRVIYNAVNFEEYHPDLSSNVLRDELKLPSEAVLFLYLARFSPSNGALSLMDISEKLKDNYPDFHFILAGLKPEEMDDYSKKVVERANGNPRIHLIPFRDDVPGLLASSDILVVPFTEPHFARSIVEASAIGKPGIGSNLGGVNELIVDNKTGLLYDNPDQFYQCCILLGNDPLLRKKLGDQAVTFAKENFDNNLNSRKVFSIYDKLLKAAI